jgi:cytochrome c-type protein NapB
MNGKLVMMLTLAVVMLAFGGNAISQDTVESLRGMTAIEDISATPETKPRNTDRKPIPRDFVQQPPLIPHSTSGYQINLKFNKCLTCHSWANYEKSRATKISQTHFTDRDGNDLANVSASRYFCTQCHVEQRDATPLVDNEFKSVDVLQ